MAETTLSQLSRFSDDEILDGVIIPIDKPYGMSSFGALAHIRYLLSQRLGRKVKIGHAGTLDPLATGVLVLCTGKKTKDIDSLQRHDKEYVATLRLGVTTPSFDREHTVDFTYPTKHITLSLIEETLEQFKGDIEQTPPAFSACKIDGKRAYKLARKGEEPPLQPKKIHIEEIELQDFDPKRMTMRIRVVCGKGTYIRSLARDLGKALNSGATLDTLRRTRTGAIKDEDCIRLAPRLMAND